MITVQIIDNTGQIQPALISAEFDVLSHDDEVKALNSVEKQQPSIILLHYRVREEKTEKYIKLLLSVCSDCKIVVISDVLDEDKILTCLIAGAKGYLDIKQLTEYASKLINVIDAGEAWVSRRLVAVLLEHLIKIEGH